jgi:two-component system, OmpR family, sensor histidine kinase QseC
MRLLPPSLQGRLLVLVVGIVAGVWLAAALATWIDVRHELDELLDSHLAQAAALLVAQQVPERDDDEHGVDAPTLHRYAPKVAFQVFHEGRLSSRSANAPTTPMLPLGGAPLGYQTVRIDGVAWRLFATQGAERDVRVFVAEQLASRQSILWALLRGMLWPMALALPLLGLAAAWAVRRGMAPLRGLGQTLAARQPQALDALVVPQASTEMVPMLAALNGLFARIAAMVESERRFTADAAHELRTPIAAIRTQAQVALAETDNALRRHALQATLAGCDRAAHLVAQLLTLSRLEGGATAHFAMLDLASLARHEVADLAPLALRKQQAIEVVAERPCPVLADAALLAALLRNLIDNAIRYSPPQATIRVTSGQRSDSGAWFRVEDSGPGLSEADARRLGERFFRVLGSGESGSGLGWSIVRRIAAALGATVTLSRSPALGGLSVEVNWADAEPSGRGTVSHP